MKKILFFIYALLIMVATMAQTPVAHYPFNGNANDAIGTNNGTANGGAALTADRFGNANSAYNFDGVDDFISTTNLATNQTDNWTMTAWVKPSSIAQNNGTIVLNGFDDGVTGNGYGVVMGDATNAAAGNLFKGLLAGVVFVNSGFTFSTNNIWYHTAMVREAGITKLYFNGVLSGTTSANIPNLPVGSLRIGSSTGIRFWNGSIDEVKIYNTALTAAQVLAEFGITMGQNYRSFQSGNWNTVSSWEVFDGTSFVAASTAPASTDGVITIRTGHNVTINTAVTADQIVVDAGGTLTQTANLTLANGVGDDLVINGTYDLQANMLAGPGNVLLQAGSQMTISTASLKQFQSATITNNGSINWQDGNIRFDAPNSSVINNGTFTISGNNTSFFNGGRLSITNNGTVTKTSTGTSNVTGILLFSNAGTLNCNGGNFVFGDGNAGGTFTNSGSLVFNTGTFSVGPGCIYNHNAGSIISGSGSFVNTGTANFNINQTFPSTISLSSTGNIAGAGDLIINSLLTIGGNITGGGLLNIKNAATWNSGLLTRNVLIDAGQTLTLATGTEKQLQNATITNNGNINWQNGNVRFDAPNSTLVNNGIFTVSANNATFFNGGRLSITNNGSFIKNTAGNSSLTGILLFSNAGTINCNNGNLNFGEGNAGGTFTNLATGTVILNNGNFTTGASTILNNNSAASINGNGVFNFTSAFNNNGIIAPGLSPGLLTINGAEPLSANSNLQIEMLNGSGAGTGHDQLIRAGNITLAGTLTVTETGAVPNGTYTIINLTSGTVSGSFATTNLPAGYSVLVNATNVQLVRTGALPLNLISFSGSKQNNDALLQWKTANEINVSRFEIQRSENGVDFITVSTVAAGGSLYSFSDVNTFITKQIVFYRLKSIDADGKFTYSGIVKLSNEQGGRFTIFPNPVKDIVTISGLKQNGTLMLFSTDGKLLQQQKVNTQSITMDLSSYATGTYLLQYENEGVRHTQKLIKH